MGAGAELTIKRARSRLVRLLGAPLLALGAVVTVAFLTFAVIANPLLALAAPVLLASAIACLRAPAAAVTLMLALCGTTSSLEAFTGISAGITVDVILAGLWGALFFSLVTTTRARPVWIWPGMVVIGLYLALTLGAVLTADSVLLGLESFRASGWYLAVVLLIGISGWSVVTHRRIARAVVLLTIAVAAYSTLRWIIGPSAAESALALQGASTFNNIGGETALFGTFSSRHQLGFWLAINIPFCLALGLAEQGRWRAFSFGAALLAILPLMATQVRAGLIGVVAGAIVVMVLGPVARGFPGLRLGAALGATAAVALIGAAAFSTTIAGSEEAADRYSNLLSPDEDPAFDRRTFKWSLALEEIDDHPLGQGLGTAGQIQERSPRFVNIAAFGVDNSYLKVAIEQGMAVMAILVAGLLALLAGLIKRSVSSPDRLGSALGLGAVGALTTGLLMFISGVYIESLIALSLWVVVGVGVAQFTGPRTPDGTTGTL